MLPRRRKIEVFNLIFDLERCAEWTQTVLTKRAAVKCVFQLSIRVHTDGEEEKNEDHEIVSRCRNCDQHAGVIAGRDMLRGSK
jgi:hypothetical protein